MARSVLGILYMNNFIYKISREPLELGYFYLEYSYGRRITLTILVPIHAFPGPVWELNIEIPRNSAQA